MTNKQYYEKQIMQLKEENNKLLDVINNQDIKIADLEQQIEKMKFWHDREEMVVIRDLLTEYMNSLGDDECFDVAIFNVRNRLNGELKNE